MMIVNVSSLDMSSGEQQLYMLGNRLAFLKLLLTSG